MVTSTNPVFPELAYVTDELKYSKFEEYVKNYDGWILIVDENTNRHCAPLFVKKLGSRPPYLHILHSGEKNKTLDRCSSIWTKLTEIRAGRNFLLVNLGGGLVSDVGGFAASCHKRGIDYINIPTSLLAMVDAAHGGKTGINYKGLKNVIGSVHMPKLILIDKDYLSTLSREELISGYAEVLKHALVADKDLWKKLKSLKHPEEVKDWSDILSRYIEIKNTIVKKDPFEHDIRRLLNFGHSIGHALETHSHSSDQMNISHGMGVAAGIVIETYISLERGMISQAECDEIQEVICSIYGKVPIDESMFSSILEIISHDKKNKSIDLNFTLLKAIGEAEIDCKVEISEINNALRKYSEAR
ncbi:MAG TPA: 3-dehydroquinate synthase [Flavobacteriales bacterium]|nr:3-dehydroquinate synthase [Flavobacteriales bacterium]